MRKLTLRDVLPRAEYEKVRPEFRRRVIEIKRRRRVALGEFLSVVFENRDTVLFQVQEMIRTERIDEPAAVLQEVEVYNDLIPGEGELRATLFIEIPDLARLERMLPRLVGVESALSLRIGDKETVPGVPDPGRSKEDKTSTVHYLTFRLTPSAREALRRGEDPVLLAVDHPAVRATAQLPPETVASLAADLAEVGEGDAP